jgi:hypothetical protein
MSTITLSTRNLVGLLGDLLLTAGSDPDMPATMGVLLHTADGEFVLDLPPDSDETPLIDAVESDLLVGMSTDTFAVGQAHVPCEFSVPIGWLRPAFVAVTDAKAVVSAFKPLASSLGRETTHRCELELTGDVLTVREDPNQVPSGLVVKFHVGDGENFPSVVDRMQPDPTMPVAGKDHEVIEPSYGTGFNGKYVEALGKISKRRKMPIAVYRHHQNRPVVVEIGSSYRAAVSPVALNEEEGQHLAPTVRVFAPPQRERKSESADA